jgi:hypothetical protein
MVLRLEPFACAIVRRGIDNDVLESGICLRLNARPGLHQPCLIVTRDRNDGHEGRVAATKRTHTEITSLGASTLGNR